MKTSPKKVTQRKYFGWIVASARPPIGARIGHRNPTVPAMVLVYTQRAPTTPSSRIRDSR